MNKKGQEFAMRIILLLFMITGVLMMLNFPSWIWHLEYTGGGSLAIFWWVMARIIIPVVFVVGGGYIQIKME